MELAIGEKLQMKHHIKLTKHLTNISITSNNAPQALVPSLKPFILYISSVAECLDDVKRGGSSRRSGAT